MGSWPDPDIGWSGQQETGEYSREGQGRAVALWLSPLPARSTQLSKKCNVILEQEKQMWLLSSHRAGSTLGKVLARATGRWVPSGQDRYRHQLRLCRLSFIDEETEGVEGTGRARSRVTPGTNRSCPKEPRYRNGWGGQSSVP